MTSHPLLAILMDVPRDIVQIVDIVDSVGLAEKAKTAKREQLLALLKDPDNSELVREFVDAAIRQAEESRERVQHISTPTGLKAAILGLRELPEHFNLNDVLRLLEAKHFAFGRSDHRNAVRDALYNMANGERPVVRVVRRGDMGKGEPNTYEFTGGRS